MTPHHYRPAWLLVERPSLWRGIVRAFSNKIAAAVATAKEAAKVAIEPHGRSTE
jgi:hypothetical protein